jgi:nitroreductase/NAD-dependent dihydropyrimidine dehydrogenase PreA subunit
MKMDWVTIDKEKCNMCMACVIRCMMCFRKKGDEIVARVDENCCNLCGHCVSLCPVDAITHHKLDMENFEDVGEGINFDTDEFIGFIRQRRSHRHFKKKEIPRDDIAKLINAVRYAPTGSNVQNVEIIVIQDQEKRKKLSDLALDYFVSMGEMAQTKLDELKAEGKDTPEETEGLLNLLRYKDRLGMARKFKFDAIFYEAPAILIFHSPVATSAPKDNCVIASTTLGLIARTMGLETTYIGLFDAASRDYEPVQKELDLPEGHKVFSTLILGYPKLKFLKTVDRTPINTRWE